MSTNLNKAIAYCMHAIKKAKGGDADELRRAMLYFNAARNMVKANDPTLALTLLNKSVDILNAIEPVDESASRIPADRMARVLSTGTSAHQRNNWMGSDRRRETGFSAAEPASTDRPVVASEPAQKAFGKRRR